MKKQLFIIPFLFFLWKPFLLLAQEGCLVPGYPELLISQSGVSGPYFNDPSLYPPANCWWTLVKYDKGCIGHGRAGVKGTYEIQCPLDTYIPLLLLITIGFSLIKLIDPFTMSSIKISIITAVYNGQQYLNDCIHSIRNQDYQNLEYIVIDGGSTDETLSIVKRNRDLIDYFVSEKDQGIYDALNKGIAAATGDVIGVLHADDVLADPTIISKIAAKFQQSNPDAVYGNLNYVTADLQKVIRKWVSKPFNRNDLLNGWMPAHPSLYIKKTVFKKFGLYSLNYGTAADYELILRLFYKYQITAVHLDEKVVDMRIGGVSNANFYQRYHALLDDYKAIKSNGMPFALYTLLGKKLGKIPQYFT